MPLFRRPETETLEAVQAKLVTARVALGALTDELRERSLAAAMEEDPGKALEPMQEKVAAARATVHALELALVEAERQEAKRLQTAADDAEKSRRRAIGQHAGAARRAAIKVREGLEQAVAGYDELLTAAERAEKLLTSAERLQLLGFGGLHGSLNDLVRTAAAQANGFRGSDRPLGRFPLAPTGLGGAPHGQHVTQLAPLEDAVAARLDLAGLLRSPGWTGRPAPPPPVVNEERGPDVPGSVPAKAASRVAARPQFEDLELPPEVAKGLCVIADPSAYTADELTAAQTALAGY